MAGRRPSIRRLVKQLTLTRLSVITAMIASLVGTAAVLGLVGGDGDDSACARTSPPQTAPASKPVVAGAVYSGETEQGEPMHFRVWVDGRTIRDLTVPMMGECSDGGPFTTTYRQGDATSFVITGGILSGSSTVRGLRGEIVGGIFRLRARFGDGGRTVRGTASEHAEIKDGGTCDTPEIAFTAAAEGGA